jgi:hypothetical protein
MRRRARGTTGTESASALWPNKLWLEFFDFTDNEVVRKRLGFTGEETVREAR